MKNLMLAIIGAVAILTATTAVNAQTTNAPPATNTWEQITGTLNDIGSASNWMFAAYGIYDFTTAKAGGGLAAVYNVTDLVGTTLRLDYINDQLWRPSGGLQIQYPIKLFNGKITVIPFVDSGLSTAIGGAGDKNGSAIAIYGTGAAIRIGSRWDILGNYERWDNDSQVRFGALYKF
jgi:hypothetical protein